MNKWDKRWFELVDLAASWSCDPSTQIGAVIIPKDSDIPVIGWNGFPRGVKDLPERYADRELKYSLVSHGESNCITNAVRNNINIKGGRIYISMPPCHECAKLIIQSGLLSVICRESNKDFGERWHKSLEISRLMFDEAGIKITTI